MEPVFDREKFRELVLYIAERSVDDRKFGMEKLYWLLFFSDLKSFVSLGQPITGASYQRLDRGPAPVEGGPVLDEMEAEGEIRREDGRFLNHRLKRVRALRSVDRALFSDDEIDVVDSIIEELRYVAPRYSPELSHLELAWEISYDGEVIPYEAVYISDRRPTLREVEAFKRGIEEWRAARQGR